MSCRMLTSHTVAPHDSFQASFCSASPGSFAPSAPAADTLTVYSGRAERLIKPVLDAFTANTGIQIELLSSGTTELVNRLKAEGDRTSADLLITNDAGSLELARTAGLLRPLNMREVERAIPAQFRASDNAGWDSPGDFGSSCTTPRW